MTRLPTPERSRRRARQPAARPHAPGLKRSDSPGSGPRQLINEMHTPGSANYHKWLTPDQFGAQFGPSDQDIATVQTWLTGHGFSVRKVNPGKQTIEISGNVAQLRSAFHTQIHKYAVNGETRFANADDPQIPAALAPRSSADSFSQQLPHQELCQEARQSNLRSQDRQGDAAMDHRRRHGSRRQFCPCSPGDFAVQYDLNPALRPAGINGDGQTIAIINESNINVDLVNQFRTLFGLPPILPRSSSTATIRASTASTTPTAPTTPPSRPISMSSGLARLRPTPTSIWSSRPIPRSKRPHPGRRARCL